MTVIRAQVGIQATSGLPADVVTNTFHFQTPLPSSDAGEIELALVAFYKSIGEGASAALASFFPNLVAQNGHTIKMYRVSDATPRLPFHEATFNLDSAPNGDPMGTQLACVLSFRGAYSSGANRARRRGRIFFGPLDKDSASGGRPSSALSASLLGAAKDLQDAAQAGGWDWGVYSPTTDLEGSSDDDSFFIATQASVDNRFDVIRSRALKTVTRTALTIV